MLDLEIFSTYKLWMKTLSPTEEFPFPCLKISFKCSVADLPGVIAILCLW